MTEAERMRRGCATCPATFPPDALAQLQQIVAPGVAWLVGNGLGEHLDRCVRVDRAEGAPAVIAEVARATGLDPHHWRARVKLDGLGRWSVHAEHLPFGELRGGPVAVGLVVSRVLRRLGG
jgi:hypothetical protein